MSDEQTAQTSATDAQAQAVPATGTETPITQAPVSQAVTAEELQAQIAKMEKALKEANKEAATKRKRLEELEKAEQERAQASMSEMDKLKAQLAENAKFLADARTAQEQAQTEATKARIRATVVSAASVMGFQNPEYAYALIDHSAVTVDGDKISGVQEQLAALAKNASYMLKGTSPRPPQVNATNPGEQASDGMTDAQIKATVFGGGPTDLFTAKGAKRAGGGVIWTTKQP